MSHLYPHDMLLGISPGLQSVSSETSLSLLQLYELLQSPHVEDTARLLCAWPASAGDLLCLLESLSTSLPPGSDSQRLSLLCYGKLLSVQCSSARLHALLRWHSTSPLGSEAASLACALELALQPYKASSGGAGGGGGRPSLPVSSATAFWSQPPVAMPTLKGARAPYATGGTSHWRQRATSMGGRAVIERRQGATRHWWQRATRIGGHADIECARALRATGGCVHQPWRQHCH